MILRPIPVKRALLFNELTHRRLPKLQGAMWAISISNEVGVFGVAIVGRPTARMLDDGTRLQVLRCSVVPGFQNACSMLYGSCSRAGRAMNARDMLTYIHDDEIGVSLKASGWVFDEEFESAGGEWDRPSRPRELTAESEPKLRYWAPWSEYAKFLNALKKARNL